MSKNRASWYSAVNGFISAADTICGISSPGDEIEFQRKGEFGPLLLNAGGMSRIEKALLLCVCTYYRLHQTLPTRNQLVRWFEIARVGCGTVSRLLEHVRRELERDTTQTAYIEYIYLQHARHKKAVQRWLSSKRLKPQPIFFSRFDCDIQEVIDNAVFTLFKYFPDKLAFLTFVFPTDSELAYLAGCDHSAWIADEIVRRILPRESCPMFVYRWEIQERKALHLHLLIRADITQLSLNKLRRAWFETLDHLDKITACNPFVDETGRDCRDDGKWVHFQSFEELEDQNKYPWSYIAMAWKPAKKGAGNRNVRVIAERQIESLGGALVAPRSHGGVSPALADLVEKTTFEVRIPIADREQYDYNEISSLKQDIVANWTPYGHSSIHGWTCRIKREDFDDVAEYIRRFDFGIPFDSTSSPWIMKIRLTPNRKLKVCSYWNQKFERFRLEDTRQQSELNSDDYYYERPLW